MARIELNDKQKMELARLMAQGQSKGEALVKMGLAVRVEQKVEDMQPAPKAKKEKPVDVDKMALMSAFSTALENFEGVEIGSSSNREIKFAFNGANYTMTLVKHKN